MSPTKRHRYRRYETGPSESLVRLGETEMVVESGTGAAVTFAEILHSVTSESVLLCSVVLFSLMLMLVSSPFSLVEIMTGYTECGGGILGCADP